MPPEAVTGPSKAVLDGPPPVPARPGRLVRPERVIGVGGPAPPSPLRAEERPVRVTVLTGHGRGRHAAGRPVRAGSLLRIRVPSAVVAPAGRPDIRAGLRVTTETVGTAPGFVVRARLLLQKLGGSETQVLTPVAAIERPSGGRAGPEPGRVARGVGRVTPTISEAPGPEIPAPRGGRPARVAVTHTLETIILSASYAPLPYS